VFVGVVLAAFFGMLRGMNSVAMRNVRVMTGRFLMMLGSFLVVFGSFMSRANLPFNY
jgi:hypothetical protein